jgi:hypothetical protein
MASHRQITANRRNAQRSTGPRTAAAKARTARNARWHGLAIPLARDPAASVEVERLAAALVGGSPNPARVEQARIAAEAEFELRRVRAHRKSVLNRRSAELAARRDDGNECSEPPTFDRSVQASAFAAALPELESLARYERRALSRRRRAMRWLMYTSILIEG